MTPFLCLAAAALFLLLAVGLTLPSVRWSYKYDTWRGIFSSLGYLLLAPVALVIGWLSMMLSPLFTDDMHFEESTRSHNRDIYESHRLLHIRAFSLYIGSEARKSVFHT